MTPERISEIAHWVLSTDYSSYDDALENWKQEQIDHEAAVKIATLAVNEALEEHIATIRPLFTEKLNLTYDQRAYSWHEMQWLIEKLEKSGRALKVKP